MSTYTLKLKCHQTFFFLTSYNPFITDRFNSLPKSQRILSEQIGPSHLSKGMDIVTSALCQLAIQILKYLKWKKNCNISWRMHVLYRSCRWCLEDVRWSPSWYPTVGTEQPGEFDAPTLFLLQWSALQQRLWRKTVCAVWIPILKQKTFELGDI